MNINTITYEVGMIVFAGTVSLWCPKVKEPLVKMLCHGSGVRSIAVDKSGK